MYNRSVAIEYLAEVPLFVPKEPGPWRLADYLALPDEPRCELLRGLLVVTPAPSLRHQLVVGFLFEKLLRYARSIGGRAVVSPVDVVLGDETVLQPDVVLLSPDRLARGGDRITGAPDLVVEVVSPGSARRDRLWKRELYRQTDVREYWVVDPTERVADLQILTEGRFELIPLDGERYRSPTFPGLELDLAALWRELDDPRAAPIPRD
ncbi:MAG TPA: Uma2 family endonuclease [Thermoanaerobaculia bacterium]